MKYASAFRLALLCFAANTATLFADALVDGGSNLKVPPAAPLAVRAFPLADVRLLDGPLKRALDLDKQYLLALDVDRLLHNFRTNAGLASTAQPLGGWEEPKCELRGHFVGHYLSACALMYAATGDDRVKQKGDALVAGLAECQAKIGNGYLSAFPEEFFDRLESRTKVWAPYYTLHKLYAGLLDMYEYCGNQRALDVCRKFGDWVIARNEKLSDEQMQKMLGTEHGGMCEALANLYAVTGDEKYLRMAQRFNHQAIIGPASNQEDKLTGLHANTQIPKFIGAARQYELTGDKRLQTAASFFWDKVVDERSYVIGGNSDKEGFTRKESLSKALGEGTCETCNTYNMLKLTRHLFCLDPQARYADYYERALYNHILASQNPETGTMCYFIPLQPGSRKYYSGPTDSFWCCTGTGVENHAKYADSIYFHGQSDLYVNLFIASELSWKEKGLTLRQETKYPEQGLTRMSLTCDKPLELAIHVRRPWWTTKTFEIRINGQKQEIASQPGDYAVVKRTWTSGDSLEVAMPFTLRTEGFRDNPQRFAFLDGPLVLCAQVAPDKPLPCVFGDESAVLSGLAPVAGGPSTFRGSPQEFRVPGRGQGEGVVLEPLYKMHGDRHFVVYWDLVPADQWAAKEAEYEAAAAKRKEIEARVVDAVKPGNEQNERDHNVKGEHTSLRVINDRKSRQATESGWFSWDLKVFPDKPQQLRITCWGGDTFNGIFDIFIDDAKLVTHRLVNKPGQFLDQIFALPPEMLDAKDKVTIKFQALPGAVAGGVFALQIEQTPPTEK
jgi:uncharacterized protein